MFPSDVRTFLLTKRHFPPFKLEDPKVYVIGSDICPKNRVHKETCPVSKCYACNQDRIRVIFHTEKKCTSYYQHTDYYAYLKKCPRKHITVSTKYFCTDCSQEVSKLEFRNSGWTYRHNTKEQEKNCIDKRLKQAFKARTVTKSEVFDSKK